jgi:predicted dehydrogenase
LIRIALAGAGEWGRNHVRALASMASVSLAWVIDPDAERLEQAALLAPGARLSADLGEALADPRLDALVVSSPSPTHGPIARAALAAGKHVLVEKPLAPTAAEAEDLVARARRAGRVLSVGHLLLYHPAVAHLKRTVERGGMGRVLYLYGQRTNLGRIRTDEGALTSLAPHDVSVMVHLLGAWPVGVAARGRVCVQPRWEDVVFVSLRFPGDVMGHVHLSWLEPLKVRRLSMVGDRCMAVFDDMEPVEKVRIHAKPPPPRPGASKPPVASAPGRAPRLPRREPLRAELEAFVRSVRTGVPTITPGEDGARVVRVLEAAQASLEAGGRETSISVR